MGECEPCLKSKFSHFIPFKISSSLSQTHEFEWPDSWFLNMEGLRYWSVTAVSDHVMPHSDPNGQLARMLHAGICRFCWPYVCIKDKLVCSSLSRQSAQLYAQLDVAFQLLADCQHGSLCCMELGTLGNSISGTRPLAVLLVLVDNGMAKQIAVIPSMPTAFSFDDLMCRYEITVTCQALAWWAKWKWRA